MLNDSSLLNLAHQYAARNSNCPTTKVGCAIARPIGLANAETPTYRTYKLYTNKAYSDDFEVVWVRHAEHSALLGSARDGICTLGATMFVTLFPCLKCARLIVESGVARLVCSVEHMIVKHNDPKRSEKYQWEASEKLMLDANIIISYTGIIK